MRWRAAAALLLAAPAWAQSPALLELDRTARVMAAAGCAHPAEEKSTRVGNTDDEMRSVDCRSHRIAYYRSGGREQPMALVVQGRGTQLPPALAPGSKPADVMAVLGAPAERREHTLVYLPRPRDRISFEIDDNERVRAVSFSWDTE